MTNVHNLHIRPYRVAELKAGRQRAALFHDATGYVVYRQHGATGEGLGNDRPAALARFSEICGDLIRASL